VSATVFTGNLPVAARASARRVFGACLFQGLAQDLGFHGLAAEQALELAHLRLAFAHATDGDDLLVGPDRLLPAFCHAPPPLEEEAGGDAVEPGDGGDRHAGLHGLLDQPDLFLGRIAPAALAAGDGFDAFDGFRYGRTPRLAPRPSGLRPRGQT
jgi:hypothetical protein